MPVGSSGPIVTVGALVMDPADRGLFVRTHKWRGLWGLPGGKIATGERMAEALVREIREETGLEIDDARFVIAQEAIDSAEFHRPAHMILLNWVCRSVGGPVALCDEAQEYRWVPLLEALEMPLNSYTRSLVEHVLEFSPCPKPRSPS